MEELKHIFLKASPGEQLLMLLVGWEVLRSCLVFISSRTGTLTRDRAGNIDWGRVLIIIILLFILRQLGGCNF